MPVIGLLGTTSLEADARLIPFRQGLKETGFVEGQNVAIEYRWAEARNDRFPALAADLVQRQVTVIVSLGGTPARLRPRRRRRLSQSFFRQGSIPLRRDLSPA